MAMAQHPEKKDGPQRPVERWTLWRVKDPTGRGFDSGWFTTTVASHLEPNEVEAVEVVPALVAERLAEALRETADDLQRVATVTGLGSGEWAWEQLRRARAALEAYSGDST